MAVYLHDACVPVGFLYTCRMSWESDGPRFPSEISERSGRAISQRAFGSLGSVGSLGSLDSFGSPEDDARQFYEKMEEWKDSVSKQLGELKLLQAMHQDIKGMSVDIQSLREELSVEAQDPSYALAEHRDPILA